MHISPIFAKKGEKRNKCVYSLSHDIYAAH